jgi:hypothetical protein
MAIAKDALTTSNLASFTHTPVGTPRGVLVMVPNESATDQVSACTYGGVAMTEVTLSPLLASGAEGGALHGFFLGSSVPTGPQTVAATVAAGSPHFIVQSATAGADMEVITTGTINLTGVTGAQTGTLALGGREAIAVEVGWCSGSAVTATTQLTNWTGHNESDEGAEINFRYSYDIVGTSDITFGVTITGTEDIAVLAVAFGEVVGGGSTYTLDADSASYTYSATAAGLEFDRLLNADAASYTYTATAAGLEFDRQIAADAASYVWTATDAALEYNQQLVAESAAYLWTASDAALEYTPAASTYTLDADGTAYLWTATDAALDYVPIIVPSDAARGGDPVPGDRLPRRIKRETYEKRGRTLRELFEPSPRAPVVAPPLPAEIRAENNPPPLSRESIATDLTPLLDALTSLRELRAERELAQAIEADDAEVLMVAV